MRSMNIQETTAKKYLDGLSKGGVKFEPDGNIPPDFSLGSNIGVEVRRLNENYFAPNGIKGLEEVDIPLHGKLNEILRSYDRNFDGLSYWVGITYKRPLQGGITKAGKEMSKTLDGFLSGPRTTPCELKVDQSISLEIISGTSVPNRLFRYGLTSDDDSGGLVVELYGQNIFHCIQEKSRKIAPYKTRYKEWWLLLVDTMGAWDMLPHEAQQVRAGIPNVGSFDRLVLIDYLGDKCFLDIP